MQYLSDEVCLANARQASVVHKFVHVLQLLDKLEELDLTWDKVRDFRAHELELDMVATTVELALLDRPTSGAMLWRVLELPLRYQYLESVCFLFAKFDTNFISCHVKGLANCLSRK